MTPPAPAHHHQLRLTAALNHILDRTRPDPATPDAPHIPFTINLIIDSTGERAFGVLMAFLCLPFLLPFTIPGSSGPFGLALMVLGLQLAIRKHRPWLPTFVRRRKLPEKFTTKLITGVAKLFRPLERLIRPRLLFMQHSLATALVGVALMLDAFLLALPWPPFIPLSNTLPAWIALIKILGITEEDGLALLLGLLLTLTAITTLTLITIASWSHITTWLH
jgi:hypothetical protein